MSSNIKIRPSDEGTDLSKDLKFILKKSYLKDRNSVIVDECSLKYFIGLRDAGCEDAQIVIDFIKKYEYCEIFEVF